MGINQGFPFVSNFEVGSVIEGPQILATWDLPVDTDSTTIKLIRKIRDYPEDETDGTELVSSAISSAPVSYVDLNPAEQQAWCYAIFTYHSCSASWTANTLIESDSTVIPTAPNGFFYISSGRGLTGASEPTWPTTIGDAVIDGDVVWTCFAANPSWVVTNRSRGGAFTWDSEYMQRLLFRTVPTLYRNEDAKSTQTALAPQQDADNLDVWRAIHEDGVTPRGEFERFLLIFGAALSRVRGAADFYPRMVDPDETLPEFLPFLAGILGWELDTTFPTAKQRQDLMSAVPIYKIKGTEGSLEPSLRQALGVDDVLIDPMSHHIMMTNRTTRLSAQGQVAGTYTSWVTATAYSRGDIVVPTSANKNGYYYQAREGGTSGGGEPSWPTTPGDDVTDGATIIWRTVQFGIPHLTADASAGASSLTVDDTTPFTAGQTINIRDSSTPDGEEIVVDSISAPSTLNLDGTTVNAYTMQDNAVTSPAYDWYDDETGFIWDIPLIDDFDGVDPDRVRVPGEIIEPSLLYSFEILRVWILLQAGESVSQEELDKVAKIMEQFSPADTSYVVRIEGP